MAQQLTGQETAENKGTESPARMTGQPLPGPRKRNIYDFLCISGGIYGAIVGLAQLCFLGTAQNAGLPSDIRLQALRAVDVAGFGQALILVVVSILGMLEFDLAKPLEHLFQRESVKELRITGYLKSPEDIRLFLAGFAFLTCLILGFGATNWALYFLIPAILFGISFIADVTGTLNPLKRIKLSLKK